MEHVIHFRILNYLLINLKLCTNQRSFKTGHLGDTRFFGVVTDLHVNFDLYKPIDS